MRCYFRGVGIFVLLVVATIITGFCIAFAIAVGLGFFALARFRSEDFSTRRHLLYVSIFVFLAAVAVLAGFNAIWAIIVGGVSIGLFFIAFWRSRERPRFFHLWVTPMALFIAGLSLFAIARHIQPEIRSPKPPTPKTFAFVVSPQEKHIRQLHVKVITWFPYRFRKEDRKDEQGDRECQLMVFTGAEVDPNPDWKVITEMQGVKPEWWKNTPEMQTTMSPHRQKGRGKGEEKDMVFEPARNRENKIAICWPLKQHVFDKQLGSNGAISLPSFKVLKGDPEKLNIKNEHQGELHLRGKDVEVDAVMSQCRECPALVDDWAVDIGPEPTPVARWPETWEWIYRIPIEKPVYASSVKIRVHSLAKAEEEHRREFISAVLYGVAAAAWVATTQEALNRIRKESRTEH
ncbi:hypothetical protein [Streptomyces sp. NPDC001816]|uniref:hypothetical protein n=1 Tax=Streptomyces sp. NPDC001816 TaxID=3364612 RepID=UPI0036CAB1E2